MESQPLPARLGVGTELNPLSELGQTLAAIANPWIMVDVYCVKQMGYFGCPDDLLPFSLNNHG